MSTNLDWLQLRSALIYGPGFSEPMADGTIMAVSKSHQVMGDHVDDSFQRLMGRFDAVSKEIVDEIRETNANVERQARETNSNLEERIRDTNDRIGDSNDRIGDSNDRIDDSNDRIRDTNQRITQLDKASRDSKWLLYTTIALGLLGLLVNVVEIDLLKIFG